MNKNTKRACIIGFVGILALSIGMLSQSSSEIDRSPASNSESPSPSASPTPLPLSPTRFNAPDQAFRERRSEKRALEALEAFRELYKANPLDWEAAWRVSMGCYFAGNRIVKTDAEMEKLHAEGRDVGLIAIKNGPEKCAPCHFWTAINMALYGQAVGVLKMLFSIPDIRKHTEASILADPTYAYAGGYRLIGKIYEKVPGIFGGSNSKAKEYYEKAIQTAPGEPLNYYFLAQLLKNEIEDLPAAIAVAESALKTIPPPTPDRVEAVDAIQDLKKFLEVSKTSGK